MSRRGRTDVLGRWEGEPLHRPRSGPHDGHGAAELVTVGETMAAFVRPDPTKAEYRVTCIGAESNVAIGYANLGGSARWVSRLGQDELGRHVHQVVGDAGVDALVRWDPVRPTGVCVKEVTSSQTSVRYYRTNSAASQIDPSDLPDLREARWLHLTGITPALSATAAATVRAAVKLAREASVRISFDVNLRPALWKDLDDARVAISELCSQADLILVGDDEAHSLAAADDPHTFADRMGLSGDQELVFKRGPNEATVLARGTTHSRRPDPVAVADLTGAGDAFAAGYLAASTVGLPPPVRLDWAHWSASRVIRITDDVAPRPTDLELEQLRQRGTPVMQVDPELER